MLNQFNSNKIMRQNKKFKVLNPLITSENRAKVEGIYGHDTHLAENTKPRIA